ncbi:MAG: FtsB family cell division protein [Flavobacteriales bacterium]
MKRRIPSWIKNKYFIAMAFFLLWICLFNDIDLFYIIRSRREVGSLRDEVKTLERENETALKSLADLSNNQASLEKFARETYYMKRDNEDVFVFKERAD